MDDNQLIVIHFFFFWSRNIYINGKKKYVPLFLNLVYTLLRSQACQALHKKNPGDIIGNDRTQLCSTSMGFLLLS